MISGGGVIAWAYRTPETATVRMTIEPRKKIPTCFTSRLKNFCKYQYLLDHTCITAISCRCTYSMYGASTDQSSTKMTKRKLDEAADGMCIGTTIIENATDHISLSSWSERVCCSPASAYLVYGRCG